MVDFPKMGIILNLCAFKWQIAKTRLTNKPFVEDMLQISIIGLKYAYEMGKEGFPNAEFKFVQQINHE